jgi:ABC-type glycerol-3-phosphate transport system substrate-binding protein
MRMQRQMARTHCIWILVLVLQMALLASCSTPWGAPAAITPENIATPDMAPVPVLEPAGPQVITDRQIVIWLPDELAPALVSGTQTVLESAIYQFEQASGVRIELHVKPYSGPSSLFNYLRSVQRVAPSIMPDMVLVNTQQLWQLADLGIIPALTDAEVPTGEDFYPFALPAVTYANQSFGYPFLVDIVHGAFHTSQFSTPPLTWADLETTGQKFLFPVGGDGLVGGASLQQYLGAGGNLGQAGELVDEGALASLFSFLRAGQVAGVIPQNISELATFDAVWQEFLRNESSFAIVNAGDYLTQHEGILQIQHGPSPTQVGAPVTVAENWAFAILARSDAQRALLLELVNTFYTTPVHSQWSQRVHLLPSRRSALQAWANPNPYQNFLGQQLEYAVAIPNGRPALEFIHRLNNAQAALLRGEFTVEEALEEVQIGD